MHFVVLSCERGMQLSCAVRFHVFLLQLCFLVTVECSCLVMCTVVLILLV